MVCGAAPPSLLAMNVPLLSISAPVVKKPLVLLLNLSSRPARACDG